MNKFVLLAAVLLSALSATAQVNSPFSRYGLGDLIANQNIHSRGMGGVATALPDTNSVNFTNPAALSNISLTTFDFGTDIFINTIKSNNTAQNYTSKDLNISYLQLAFPLYYGRLSKKNRTPIAWSGSFGIKPVTRVNYKLNQNTRLPGIDSVSNIFNGTGGLSQANFSTAVRIKNLSVGITGGYAFGNKDFNTQVNLINDTVLYYTSSRDNQSNFGGLFANAGVQYYIKTKNNGLLTLGAYTNLQQKLKGSRTLVSRTITEDVNGNTVTIDTVSFTPGAGGNVIVPASYSAGFSYKGKGYLIGADFTTTQWNNYRYFGEKDAAVQNSWMLRSGFEYKPSDFARANPKYRELISYRFGLRYGKDYVQLGDNRPDFGVSVGAGLPLVKSALRSTEPIKLNTAVEYSFRGSKNVGSIRENIVKISLGVSFNALWFRKAKYF